MSTQNVISTPNINNNNNNTSTIITTSIMEKTTLSFDTSETTTTNETTNVTTTMNTASFVTLERDVAVVPTTVAVALNEGPLDPCLFVSTTDAPMVPSTVSMNAVSVTVYETNNATSAPTETIETPLDVHHARATVDKTTTVSTPVERLTMITTPTVTNTADGTAISASITTSLTTSIDTHHPSVTCSTTAETAINLVCVKESATSEPKIDPLTTTTVSTTTETTSTPTTTTRIRYTRDELLMFNNPSLSSNPILVETIISQHLKPNYLNIGNPFPASYYLTRTPFSLPPPPMNSRTPLPLSPLNQLRPLLSSSNYGYNYGGSGSSNYINSNNNSNSNMDNDPFTTPYVVSPIRQQNYFNPRQVPLTSPPLHHHAFTPKMDPTQYYQKSFHTPQQPYHSFATPLSSSATTSHYHHSTFKDFNSSPQVLSSSCTAAIVTTSTTTTSTTTISTATASLPSKHLPLNTSKNLITPKATYVAKQSCASISSSTGTAMSSATTDGNSTTNPTSTTANPTGTTTDHRVLSPTTSHNKGTPTLRTNANSIAPFPFSNKENLKTNFSPPSTSKTTVTTGATKENNSTKTQQQPQPQPAKPLNKPLDSLSPFKPLFKEQQQPHTPVVVGSTPVKFRDLATLRRPPTPAATTHVPAVTATSVSASVLATPAPTTFVSAPPSARDDDSTTPVVSPTKSSSDVDDPDKIETDPHRLQQRQKQVDYGHRTLGYVRYRLLVPVDKRDPELQPQTPRKTQCCSKRSWDGQVKKWRRDLHKWDPTDPAEFEILTKHEILATMFGLEEIPLVLKQLEEQIQELKQTGMIGSKSPKDDADSLDSPSSCSVSPSAHSPIAASLLAGKEVTTTASPTAVAVATAANGVSAASPTTAVVAAVVSHFVGEEKSLHLHEKPSTVRMLVF